MVTLTQYGIQTYEIIRRKISRTYGAVSDTRVRSAVDRGTD